MAAGKDRMKLLTSKIHFLLAIALCALSMSLMVAAQQTPVPPTPQPTREVGRQKEKEKEKEKTKMPMPAIPGALPPGVEMGDGTTTERSIAVDPKVSIQMCVTEGT